MRTPKTLIITAVISLSAVGLVGCGGDDTTDDTTAADTPAATPTAEAPATEETTPEATDDAMSGELTAFDAINAALAEVPGGVAVEGGQTDEQGRQVWYVLVRDANAAGTELYVDTMTGEIVSQRGEELPQEAQGQLPALTAQEGMNAALAAVPDTSVVAFDLGTEDGATVWAVVVGGASGETEVYVDAATGGIVKTEATD
ncbi:MAG: PepSY domain-containing protein [Jiangellales bacterium]